MSPLTINLFVKSAITAGTLSAITPAVLRSEYGTT